MIWRWKQSLRKRLYTYVFFEFYFILYSSLCLYIFLKFILYIDKMCIEILHVFFVCSFLFISALSLFLPLRIFSLLNSFAVLLARGAFRASCASWAHSVQRRYLLAPTNGPSGAFDADRFDGHRLCPASPISMNSRACLSDWLSVPGVLSAGVVYRSRCLCLSFFGFILSFPLRSPLSPYSPSLSLKRMRARAQRERESKKREWPFRKWRSKAV